MAVVKKKLSKSAWVLIAIVIVAIIALPLLHFVGIIDLSFIGVAFMSTLMWAASDVLNGILFVAGVFVAGALVFYAVKKYIIGTKLPTGAVAGYTPIGQTVSQPQQKDDETVVSS